MIGYKIFRLIHGEYRSFHVSSFHYKKGRNVPIFGPFAVFDTKEDLLEFFQVLRNIIDKSVYIWKVVEYEPSVQNYMWNYQRDHLSLAEAPPGTRLARSVTILDNEDHYLGEQNE